MSDKRKALLAQKQKILEEIKYYEARIEEARTKTKNTSFYEDDDSSDSDTELIQVDNGPTVRELKNKQLMLKTCLHATQELTSLEVLQSEVNVLVDDPPLNGVPPVKGEGVWREVVAECCLDLVPFAITFYVFKANRNFAPLEYRGLKVTAIKKAHEVELSKSVLPTLTRPSDAIEVIRSYALAHRSRRSTLARLANKFNSSLVLEPIPEGGYRMKCANLLDVSWTLQNKWSPIAPFHHRMKFDLEYMAEEYIRIITQAHRQISEPDVDTDERTLLLAKIISTCLEAQGPTQELHDSMSSDPETAHTLNKRRTTLDREPEAPVIKRAKKDHEVMAPPKEVPKKVKKGKENVDSNKKTTKRPIENSEDVNNPKKAKKVENGTENEEVIETNDNNDEEMIFNNDNRVSTAKNDQDREKAHENEISKRKSVKKNANEKQKMNENPETAVQNTEKPKIVDKAKKSVQSNEKPATKVAKTSEKTDKPNETTKTTTSEDKVPKSGEKTIKSANNAVKPVNKGEPLETNSNKTDKVIKKPQTGVKVVKDKETVKVVKKAAPRNIEKAFKNNENNENAPKSDKTKNSNTKNAGPVTNSESNKNTKVASNTIKATDNVAGNTVEKNTKKTDATGKTAKPTVTDKISNKETGNIVQKVKKVVSASNTNTKVSEKAKVIKTIPGKASVVNVNKISNVAHAEKTAKTNSVENKLPKMNTGTDKTKKIVPKVASVTNKPKATIPSKKISGTGNTNKVSSAGKIGKENAQNNLKISKIPLKKFSSENAMKLPSRVSPRHPVMKSKILSKFDSGTKLKPK